MCHPDFLFTPITSMCHLDLLPLWRPCANLIFNPYGVHVPPCFLTLLRLCATVICYLYDVHVPPWFFYPYDVHAFVIKFSEFSGYLRKINEKFMILRVRGVAFRPLGGAHGPQQAPGVHQKRDPKATQTKRPPREAQRSPLGRFSRNRLGAHVHLRQGNKVFQRWTLFCIFFVTFCRENVSRDGVGLHVKFEWESLSEDQSCHFSLSVFLYFSRKSCFSRCWFWMRITDRGSIFHFFSVSLIFSWFSACSHLYILGHQTQNNEKKGVEKGAKKKTKWS